MRLENSFEVPASVDEAWALLNDIPRVVPCMPGAELVDTVDENSWRGVLRVRLGPVSLQFELDVTRREVDSGARKVVLETRAREIRGRGAANATIESRLGETDAGTLVEIVTELALQGPVAQYGQGIIPDVSSQLTREFAGNLATLLAEGSSAAAEGGDPEPRGSKQISGLRLGARALWSAVVRRIRRVL
jgi:carbon monoxide dehydrogenase subunit G